MYKLLAVLALCISAGVARPDVRATGPSIVLKGKATQGVLGVVDPAYRCGGIGTPLQLRISECEGKCRFTPGRLYECEKDFMPSSAAPSLSLIVEICYLTVCSNILEAVLPNSSVQPGYIYTARYSIVPNDILSGNTVQFKGYIYHTDTFDPRVDEICVSADVDIL